MKKMLKNLRNEEGFTLIEMSIVLIIIALLLIFLIPNIGNVMNNATGTTDTAIINTVETQMELYKADKNETTLPSAVTLESEKYISIEQLNAYNQAKEREVVN